MQQGHGCVRHARAAARGTAVKGNQRTSWAMLLRCLLVLPHWLIDMTWLHVMLTNTVCRPYTSVF